MASLEYVRIDTPVHRLSPYAKASLLLMSLVIAFALDDIALILIWIGFLLVWWKLAKIKVSKLTLLFKLLLATSIFLIAIQGFMYAGGKTPLFTLFHFRIYGEKDIGIFTLEGLIWGLMLSLRVYCAVLAIPLFTMTTPMTDIAASLAKLRVPYAFVLTFVTAMRFVPVASNSWSDIMLAQQIRALDLRKMNFATRAIKIYPKAVPTLVLFLLRKANVLQIALESRCFGLPVKRTFVSESKLLTKDYLVIFGMLALLIALITFRIIHGQIVPIGGFRG